MSENQNHNLIAKGAVLTKLSDQYSFTEGPVADKKGNIFFTDQPNNRIMKWSVDGVLSVYMENAGRANGLYFDREGNLLACADEKNEIWKIDPNKNITVLVNDFEGKRLNGPNDLWVDPKGGIYFTDPFYKRDYWKHTSKEIEKECVYYLSPDKTKITNVASDLIKPNGIIGTSNGKILYVADIEANKTYSYKINNDGSLDEKTLFTESGSDGITIDEAGNIYLTGKGVTIFNPKGEKIAHIAVKEPWTANVCFGGKKFKTLFITAGKSVYTLEMNIKGMK
ncbi:MAG TPA: SMP-30/gluconolactonase/LRE family protein [Flavobacterium sp.]|uniref:SMP-30/gluconolactonase/LRE family protein n=1 Tax=Flavobacterium sp. TaxID=239 RepID=UPI002ED29036